MGELVSVIMPVHNAERYLEEAIRSVMAQTYGNWELLVVNDNSSDNSVQIANKMAKEDCRIKVYDNPTPTGYPATPRNMAVNLAQGRYIAFLDSDDVWLPCKLEHQLPFFAEAENIGVVFSNYEKVDEETNREARVIKARKRTKYKQLLLGNVIGNVTAMYDTERVGKVYFPMVRHEDYAMWLSILKRGFIARNTGKVVALYRVSENSVSSRKMALLSWQWRVYRDVEQICLLKSAYYYINYAIRAFLKSLI
ncbi:MAG: glycosyltransferase family 2 protein [Bacteroidaceae bacterium]|nr:glycosyltransferase family 2 protein [Bacteroidaceae bacterium]